MAGSTRYKNDWQKKNLDRISLTVPKGRREQIQSHASAHGESVNGFINRAVRETIERDQAFEQNKDEIIAIAQRNHVDVDIAGIDEQGFKKIVEALTVLESMMPNIKSYYFKRLFFQDHSSGVLVIDRDKIKAETELNLV